MGIKKGLIQKLIFHREHIKNIRNKHLFSGLLGNESDPETRKSTKNCLFFFI